MQCVFARNPPSGTCNLLKDIWMESQDQVASCVCARQLFIPSFILYVVLSARIPEAETPPHTQFRLITKSIQGFMMFKRFENPTCQIQENTHILCIQYSTTVISTSFPISHPSASGNAHVRLVVLKQPEKVFD
jgi:hypothetical protein